MRNLVSDWFNRTVGVDLGSAAVRVSLPPHESILSEPSVVVRNLRSNRIVAVGQSAADLEGRIPDHYEFIRPIEAGRVDNPEAVQVLLSEVLRTHRTIPEAIIGQRFLAAVPANTDDVDRRTLVEVFDHLDARYVAGVRSTLAALIGVGATVKDPMAQMVVDIGRDRNQAGVVSKGGVVQEAVHETAGRDIDAKIINFMTDEFSLAISRLQARDIKRQLGAAGNGTAAQKSLTVYGQDVASRLPREVSVTSEDIKAAIQPAVDDITGFVQSFVQSVSADIASDIYTHGIHLVGGTARLPGLTEELADAIGVAVYDYDEPETAVITGLGKITDRPELRRPVTSMSTHAATN